MKRASAHHIAQTWKSGGPYVGTKRPAVRVTVEIGWQLREQGGAFFDKGPVRWYQRANNSQVETELPNLLEFSISESIDEDAASCTIKLTNQKLDLVDPGTELGNPGYYTWSRGESTIAINRWGHAKNAWYDILTPNALIRTYEGFGGHNKTLAQALVDGNLVMTGVFLVDEVTVRPGAILELKCRNMAKLLLDQPIFPPLVPETDANGCSIWPLQYSRWFNLLGTQTRTIRYGDLVSAGRHIVGFEFAPDTDPCGVGEGYWLVGDDGGVFTYGYQSFYGSMGGVPLAQPLVGIARTGSGRGYWTAAADGGVFSFGDAPYYGGLPGLGIGVTDVVRIEATATGNGYYLLRADGSVYSFGDAVYYGGGGLSGPAVGMAVKPGGYWIVANNGDVYAFGSATHHGNVPDGFTDIVAIETSAGQNGYLIVRADGAVYAFGDAPYYGSPVQDGMVLNDPIVDIIVHPNGRGYWLGAEDGGVFTYGTVSFYGSLPGPWINLSRVEGNYVDYADIVKDLLLWSGFWLNDGGVAPNVYGNIESTGVYSPEPLKPEFFDKQPVMDVITKLKEIVGYITWVDGEGGFHFESPNFWKPGNFLLNGTHINEIPQIDEIVTMTGYGVQFGDRSLRSEIVISNYMPSARLDGTVTTRFVPQGKKYLKGMIRPMLWVNDVFTDERTQQTMAELIDLHMWFQNRLGSVTCAANPLIDINDQVRLYERETAETYIHYVRSVERSFDAKTGQYMMNLVTNWLGDDNSTDLGPGAGGGAGGVGTGESWAVNWPVAFTPKVTDTIGMVDSLFFEMGRGESLFLSDAVFLAFGLTRLESMAPRDSVRASLGTTRAESVGVVDSAVVVATFNRSFSEPVGLRDDVVAVLTLASGAIAFDLLVTDPVGIRDPLTSTAVAVSSQTDTSALRDSVRVLIAPVQTDALAVTDSVVTGFSHTDTLGLADSVQPEYGRVDALGLSDSRTLTINEVKVDTLPIRDVI